MRLFFDACIVICQVEAAGPFFSRVAKAVSTATRGHRQMQFAVSRLSVLECLVHPLRDGDSAAVGRHRDFFGADDLQIVEPTPGVIGLATRLRAVHGIRTPDAIQAASALSLPGRTIFMTGDVGFRKVDGLETVIV